jgi:hypothetical protein
MNRRLTITAVYANGIDLGFRVTTEVQNRLGYWTTHSEGMVTDFPMHTVTRLGQNPEFTFVIRAEVR